jgi:replicative DNA helicase
MSEQATKSEQAVLGCLLLYPNRFALVNQILDREDFYSTVNQNIFEAFSYYHSIGAEADITLLEDRFKSLAVMVDKSYLLGLSETLAFENHLPSYCKSVKEASHKRSFVKVLESALYKANTETLLTKDLAAELMRDTLKIDTFQEDKFDMRGALDAYYTQVSTPDKLVSLGFRELDAITNGGANTHSLIVIASDSGVGKTTITTNMLVNKALKGEKCLYVNLEIPVIDMIENIAPMLSDDRAALDYKRLITVEPDQLEGLREFIEERLSGLGIYFARNCYTKEEIVAQMDLHRIDYGVTSCFIDHAQLIEGAEDYTRYVGITKEFKRYCLRHTMPIFLLCQMNDKKDQRADKEPYKTDMRGGANLYQDADIVLFLYKLDQADRVVYLKLGKNRKGSTGQAQYYLIDFNETTRKVKLKHLMERPKKEEETKRKSRYAREY